MTHKPCGPACRRPGYGERCLGLRSQGRSHQCLVEFTSDPESFGSLMYPEAGPMKHSPVDASFCMHTNSYISQQDGGCSLSVPVASHACDPLAVLSLDSVWPQPACSCLQTRNWSGGRRDLLPATEEFHLKTGKEPQDLGCQSSAQTWSCKEAFCKYNGPCVPRSTMSYSSVYVL